MNYELANCTMTSSDVDGYLTENRAFDFMGEITFFARRMFVLGLINLTLSYIFVFCFNYAAQKQTFKIRKLFLQAVLRQDIGWYDVHQTTDFAARMNEDLGKLQDGIGEKVGIFLYYSSVFISDMIVAFIFSWQLTLVCASLTPLAVLAGGGVAMAQQALTGKELSSYGKAGAIAEEVLSSIRTVVSFNGQKKEVSRYEAHLGEARKAGITRGILTAVGNAINYFLLFFMYALAFWFGTKMILDDRE